MGSVGQHCAVHLVGLGLVSGVVCCGFGCSVYVCNAHTCAMDSVDIWPMTLQYLTDYPCRLLHLAWAAGSGLKKNGLTLPLFQDEITALSETPHTTQAPISIQFISAESVGLSAAAIFLLLLHCCCLLRLQSSADVLLIPLHNLFIPLLFCTLHL